MPCPHTFFSLGFVFGEVSKNKCDVCQVLCEELLMLDGRPYKAKLVLKQFGVVSLILLVYKF